MAAGRAVVALARSPLRGGVRPPREAYRLWRTRRGGAGAPTGRARRIAPRDARLWQQLARIRLQQGQYQQAESLAARSNTWAGSDNALRAENWKLIAQARDARGDAAGARAAQQNAERYAP